MQNVLDTGKRVFSAAIAAATIAFTVGAGALLSPVAAHAASAGDLIKGTSLTTVYYEGYDGMRYAFPNEKTYFSWYADFNDVITISDTELAGITLGGNIVVRPGTNFIKVTSDAKTYAVGRDGNIHWIESEAVANDLAGSDWASNIIDVPDVFFDDYTVGTSLMTATAFDGAAYEAGGTTFLSWDGEMRELTSTGMSANNIWDKYVLDGSNIDDSSLSMGDTISGEITALVDAAQTVTDTTVASGDLTVSAASSMPAGVSVTQGANAVKTFSFNVKAGSEDATLDAVTLSMIGAGDTSDISDVYLYEGTTRLTDARSINSSTRSVTFSNLGLDVAANSTRTFTASVTVDTAANAADTFGFEIASSGDVTSGGSIAGSFPVMGNTFTVTGADSGTVTVSKSGTVSDPTLGQNDAEIGSFKIAADTEDASVSMITLNIDNAADHSDFKLWDGTDLVATGTDIGSDLVVFDLSSDPFVIADGNNNIFTVSADIGGQAADDIKVFVDNAIDVVATGADFGFGMTVVDTTYDGDSCTSASGDCSFSSVQGGKLTLAFNGPSAGDIQIDSQDQDLLDFSMTAAQMVTIKDMHLTLAATGGDGLIDGSSTDNADSNLTDIRIVNADTGATLLGPEEMNDANDSSETIDFTEDFSLNAGETLNLKVTADVENTTDANTIFTATLVTSSIDAEDENGDSLSTTTDIVPSTPITGYSQTARAASLAFALASSPTSTSTVDGTDNVATVAFTATAGEASDVTVTDLTLTAYGDDDGDNTMTLGGETNADVNDYIESCSLYDGTTLLDGPESPTTNGQNIVFNNVDWTVAAGSSQTVTVKCNFANTSTSGNAYFSFAIAAASTDVIAEDEDGDTVTPSGTNVNGSTTATVAVTLKDVGTLTVTVGSATPSADFLLTGSADNSVSVFHFAANDESFNVNTLTFSEEQAEDDTGTGDSSAYANNISTVTISYPKADGTTGTKSVSMTGNEAKFSSLDMYVPVGTPKDVTVKVNLPGTDRDAGGSATSNEKVRMGLFVDTSNDDNYKVVGAGSGMTLDDDDQAALGAVSTDGVATFVVRETKPTITLNSLSPIGASVVGRGEVLRFTIAASANEDVVLNKLLFKITSTDNATTAGATWNSCDTTPEGTEMQTSDFDLYNLTVDNTSQTLDTSNANWALYKTTGAACDGTDAVAGFVGITLPVAEIIPKNSSNTFALYFDSTGASSSSDDSVRFDLPVDPIVSTFLTGSTIADSGITRNDATLTLTSSANFAVGDVACFSGADTTCNAGEEEALVTGITSNDVTFARGYLGTNELLPVTTQNVVRMPGSLLWQDDGSSTVTSDATSAKEYWGSYLVDNLTLSGNTLTF